MAQLGLAPGPIERVRADVAVVALFAGERPLRAAAGRVDWRLCGRLSHLFAAGRLSGAIGARRAVIALPELEIALGERLAQLARSVAIIELPAEIEIAPEPVEAP